MMCRQKIRFRLFVQFVRDLQTRPTEFWLHSGWQLQILQIRASLPNEPSSLVRLNVGTALKDRGRPIHPPPPSLSSQKSRVESTHIGQHLVYLFHLLIYLPSKVGQKFPQELLVVSALLHGLVPVDYTLGGHDCSLVLCVVVSIGDVVSALLPYYE